MIVHWTDSSMSVVGRLGTFLRLHTFCMMKRLVLVQLHLTSEVRDRSKFLPYNFRLMLPLRILPRAYMLIICKAWA